MLTPVDGQPDAWDEVHKEDPDAEFRMGLSTLIADYQAECARSRDILARHELDEVVTLPTSRNSRARTGNSRAGTGDSPGMWPVSDNSFLITRRGGWIGG